MTAHQRLIREQQAGEFPRPVATSLAGYRIAFIGREDAVGLILEYEWLGNVGSAGIFVGLIGPQLTLEGVAAFGHGPAAGQPKRNDGKFGDIRNIIGTPALCLERGACVHYAPPNAASFLISRACRLIFRCDNISRFFAYADPMAGEYGGVYQAANWTYLGQGIDGQRHRRFRTFVLPPGEDPNNPANWRTTRALRRGPRENWIGYDEAEAKGWTIVRASEKAREAKHVYAINVGHDRRSWRRDMPALPYPSPQPELKRRAILRSRCRP